MSLAEFSRLDVHGNVLIFLWVTRTKDLSIGCGINEQEFAIEYTISALEEIVFPLQRVFKRSERYAFAHLGCN